MTEKKEKEGLFRSIFIAHIILLLHIVLLAIAGVTVVLFRGVYHYLPWIMGAIGILVILTAIFFYRRMRTGASDIKSILSMPEFRDRSIQIKLMGGLASVKVDAPKSGAFPIDHQLPGGPPMAQIEEKTQSIEAQIVALTDLYEKNLITKDAFLKAKQELIQG